MITACNSVSAYAIDELKQNAPFKISGVIHPGVMALKNAVASKDDSILILGTKATIESQKYEKLLKKSGFTNITSLAPSLFVPIVEEGLFDGIVLQTVIDHYFKDLKEPDFIVLGCTHFPLISDAISRYFPNATLIHSGEAIVEYLQKEHNFTKEFEETDLKLFASENPDNLKKIAKIWL